MSLKEKVRRLTDPEQQAVAAVAMQHANGLGVETHGFPCVGARETRRLADGLVVGIHVRFIPPDQLGEPLDDVKPLIES